MTLSWSDPLPSTELDVLVAGSHRDPHQVLGVHFDDDHFIIRTFRPHAISVSALIADQQIELTQLHPAGVFSGALPIASLDSAGELPDAKNPPDYRLKIRFPSEEVIVDDSYRWLPTLGDLDQHLISEGRHERLWDVLGAHQRTFDTPVGQVSGVSFAVWAPSAQGVRVAGDFNYWDGQGAPMRMLGITGVWELFVPGLASGALYKFQILGADGVWREKADPMAFATEEPPRTASKVFSSGYQWHDDGWLAQRANTQWHEAPISIYELHIGSWRRGLSYRALADELIPYLVDSGFTHVEFLPVSEHPFGGSWGYQVSSYYAPTSRFGDPDDFRYLVDRLHQAGIGVLLDWVPAHFPKDEWALARFDGTPLYEHADPRLGEHPDWGTLIFNYGRHEVRNFLVANALYWLEEFHIDGLRVDGVASMLYLDYSRAAGEWVPNEYGGRENLAAVQFLQEMNATVYKRVPGVITIAEESTAWPGVTQATDSGGLGFGFKWNMGWMHDTLNYLRREPIFRQYHHQEMTFSLVYAHDENFILPLSHDEVVHGKASLLSKMPGDMWQRRATLRALYGYMFAHPGKKLLFMGSELGQETEWSEQRSLDWWQLDRPENRGIRQLLTDLNRLYRENDALFSRDADPAGFEWLNSTDSQRNVFSFARYGAGVDNSGEALACVINFAGTPHENYRLGLPRAGQWAEILNTDAHSYGGSGIGNFGAITTGHEPANGYDQSAVLRVPPLGVLIFRHVG